MDTGYQVLHSIIVGLITVLTEIFCYVQNYINFSLVTNLFSFFVHGKDQSLHDLPHKNVSNNNQNNGLNNGFMTIEILTIGGL